MFSISPHPQKINQIPNPKRWSQPSPKLKPSVLVIWVGFFEDGARLKIHSEIFPPFKYVSKKCARMFSFQDPNWSILGHEIWALKTYLRETGRVCST